jgi:hypothetical protein
VLSVSVSAENESDAAESVPVTVRFVVVASVAKSRVVENELVLILPPVMDAFVIVPPEILGSTMLVPVNWSMRCDCARLCHTWLVLLLCDAESV